MAANPDVVRNVTETAIAAVGVEDSAVLVLEIVSPARFQGHTVEVKPGAPECSGKEVDMSVNKTTCEVAEGEVDLVLNIEVNNSEYSVPV